MSHFTKYPQVRYICFFFFLRNLYDIDLMSAHKFVHEDLVKYANCDLGQGPERGSAFACSMNPKYYHMIPRNLTKGIMFL